MKTLYPSPSVQSGVALLEALLGVAIFSLGLIGLLGMQSAATRVTSDMKYRSEAALLAEELVNQMWADDRLALQTLYATGGAKYSDWYNNRVAAPGVGLPGASKPTNKPTVAVIQGNAATASTPTTVTITILWQTPQDASAHRYVSRTSLPPL